VIFMITEIEKKKEKDQQIGKSKSKKKKGKNNDWGLVVLYVFIRDFSLKLRNEKKEAKVVDRSGTKVVTGEYSNPYHQNHFHLPHHQSVCG